jgi:hypothetical protein
MEKTLIAINGEEVPLDHLLFVFAGNLQGVLGQVRMEAGELPCQHHFINNF